MLLHLSSSFLRQTDQMFTTLQGNELILKTGLHSVRLMLCTRVLHSVWIGAQLMGLDFVVGRSEQSKNKLFAA